MRTTLFPNPEVAAVVNSFPEENRKHLLALRELILQVGNSIDAVGTVQESLKWGEPSYTTIAGSSVRIGCKKSDPEKYAIYFHCQTSLVSTFRLLYPKTFQFEGNRAIVFQKGKKIPQKEIKHCIKLALTYHRIKHLPMLGSSQSNV